MAVAEDWGALGAAEQLYREVVEAAPDAMLVIESGAPHYLLVNAAAERLLGYGRAELLRMGPADLLDPDELPRLPEIRRRFNEAGSWRGEWRMRRKDGSLVPVEATTVRHDVGGRVLFQGLFRDIAARKRIEEALVRSEAQLAAAQAMAHLGSWEWDILEDRAIWSDELFRIFGIEPQSISMAMETVMERIAPRDRERVANALEIARTTGEDWDLVMSIVRPDGGERIVYGRGTAMRDASGRPIRMLGATQDVTDEKRAVEALRKQEQQLRSVLDHATDAIIQFDRELRIVYVNPATERVRGRPAAELLGKTSEEAGLSAARLPDWEMKLRSVFLTSREVLVDVPVTNVNGEERLHQARLSPVLGSDRSVESVTVIARDVSDRRQEEARRERLYQELMEREGRLRAMVEEILLAQRSKGHRDPDAATLLSLTPRERDILRLLAAGRTNQQIGQELHLGHGTVRNHISRMLPKLACSDRTQAAIRALELGLLDA
jgi:PAS domain S-box-containing protein